MMRRGALGATVHGGLLLVALGVAYLDWTREKTPAGRREIVIWDERPGEVDSIQLTSPSVTVDLSYRADEPGGGSERYAWFRVARERPLQKRPTPAPTAPAESASAEAAPEPPPAPPDRVVKEFLGGKEVPERVKRLARLVAQRDLGKLDEETRKKLDLDPPAGGLVVRKAKSELRLDLGALTVGDRQRYVLDRSTSKAYVVEQSVFGDLEHADTRLVNRDLHAFPIEDVETVTVRVADKTRQFVQTSRGQKEKAFWAPSEKPDEKDERVTTWIGKVAALKADKYLAEGENPIEAAAPLGGESKDAAAAAGPPPAEVVLRIDYEAPGKGPGFLELTRHGDPAGGKASAFVARTEHTRGGVLVNRFLADEAVKDLPDLLAR